MSVEDTSPSILWFADDMKKFNVAKKLVGRNALFAAALLDLVPSYKDFRDDQRKRRDEINKANAKVHSR